MNKGFATRREVSETHKKFWLKRGLSPDDVPVSTRVLGYFYLMDQAKNIYKYEGRNKPSIQKGNEATRQINSVGVVRKKCKSRPN